MRSTFHDVRFTMYDTAYQLSPMYDLSFMYRDLRTYHDLFITIHDLRTTIYDHDLRTTIYVMCMCLCVCFFCSFFVIKTFSEDDIHRSVKNGIWSGADGGNRRLDAVWMESVRNNNAKGKEGKDGKGNKKDGKDGKNKKEGKEAKDAKGPKDKKDEKEAAASGKGGGLGCIRASTPCSTGGKTAHPLDQISPPIFFSKTRDGAPINEIGGVGELHLVEIIR